MYIPQFPCEDGHVFSRWFGVMDEYMKYIDEDTIFVAHSRGCAFVWRLLEKIDFSIKAAFYVGGLCDYLWYPKSDGKKDTFYEREFDWEKIRNNSRHAEVFQSSNDPYVSMKVGKKTADLLGVEMSLVKNAGHFNTEAGYDSFPLLLERIENQL